MGTRATGAGLCGPRLATAVLSDGGGGGGGGGLQSDDGEGVGAPVPRWPLAGVNDGRSGNRGRSGTLHASYCSVSQKGEHDGDEDEGHHHLIIVVTRQ